MTAGKKITARVCALLLILAMAAALLIALPVGTTASAASLPVIEEIKLELASRPFRILEVGDNPRLKYYTYTHANFEDLIRGTATKEERAAAIAAELGSIPVLTGSPVPYTVTPYTEAYYWEALSGSSLLTIPAESRELYGVATVNAAHTGDYSAARTYRLTSGGEIGTHVLTGGYLVAGSGAGARYYYALTDSAFAQTDLGAAVGLEASTAIYEKIDGDFVYVTTYGSLQVIIDALTSGAGFDDAAFANNYYTAPEISSIAPTDTAPIPAGGEKVYYLAGGYGYAPHADGYIVEMPDLTRFALTPGAGGHDVAFGGENAITITYDKVRYTGGFTSDDWFTRYVLDAEYGSVSYEVATAASLPENIAYYDLAVLPSDCIGDAAVAAAIANKLPVIFTGGADGVEGSALSWGGELLTTGFHTTPLDATAFKAVGDAIAYENLLRRVAGNLVPQLENRITLATSIRHILNARGERSAKPLTQVRVLEVQPRYNLGDAVGTRLTAAVVADWLSGLQIQPAAGDVRPVQAADIKITTMSTAELNGRIEDLGESYELIYFGASRAHFALTGGETNFNDDVMDGLLYYNIGDTVRTTGAILGGLLTSDYTGTGAARAIATGDAASSRNFRYPGNDISASKRDALTQFAAAGYPIVFADDLTDARVDNCTHLYDFMSANLARENLFRVSEIAARRTDLLNHISLSKPTLELSSFPAPYVNMTSPTGVSPLRYAFKISDSTDATPLTTTYDVKLYIDSDASGIYTAREDVTVDVYNSSGLVRKTGGIYGLKAGAAYTAVANLPSDVVGIIPWKLEVSKNAEGGAASGHFHGSQIGYTRIKPASGQAGNINVLQIAAYGGFPNSPDGANLQNQGLATVILEANPVYQAQIATVNSSGDFKITLNTVFFDGRAIKTALAGMAGSSNKPGVPAGTFPVWDAAGNTIAPVGNRYWADGASSAAIKAFLDNFDMLVIGFADAYGAGANTGTTGSDGVGFSKALISAIENYIGEGKAVLFTHDTTSKINTSNVAADPNYATAAHLTVGGTLSGRVASVYLTSMLRTLGGMDKYGIVGHMGGAVAGAYSATAYQPQSARATPLPLKSQGFTSYALGDASGGVEWYNNVFGSANSVNPPPDHNYNTMTNLVTQVNKGQLTTYPFPIDTSVFDPNWAAKSAAEKSYFNANGSALLVAPTHNQFYELNMNTPDLVVWYALGGNGTGNGPYNYNDAANGYYIYTMGNVTYSGVGHRVNAANNAAGSVPVGEAQLFINTMIAAHRSSTIKPLVTIRDKFGAESEFLYYSGGSGELMLDSDQSADMYASYFSFTVPNAPSGATHSAAFSYSYTVDGTPQAGTFTSALNGVATAAVTPTTTTAQNIYTFHVPRGVVEKLNAAAPPSVTVTVTVTTTVAEGGVTRTYYGEDSLELRKIGLIPLR